MAWQAALAQWGPTILSGLGAASAGSKGGQEGGGVQIPEYLTQASSQNINKAQQAASLGYVPYNQAEIAGFTGNQRASMSNAEAAARAFGLIEEAPSYSPSVNPYDQYMQGDLGYNSNAITQRAIANARSDEGFRNAYDASLSFDPVGTPAQQAAEAVKSGGGGLKGAKIPFTGQSLGDALDLGVGNFLQDGNYRNLGIAQAGAAAPVVGWLANNYSGKIADSPVGRAIGLDDFSDKFQDKVKGAAKKVKKKIKKLF